MLIESDARRHITSAIEFEKEITSFEERERLKGKVVLNCGEYNKLRRKLVAKCCHINAVANIEGKGREDLGVEILTEAENVTRKVSENRSRAVRKLAEDIKKTFFNLRLLLRKYDKNIDSVDPQLKNNPELVELLVPFEKSWEKGKEFFGNSKTSGQLIHLSQLIEGVSEKHKEAQEKIDSIDTEIFFIIPCLVVLNSFNEGDEGICADYYPILNTPGTPEREQYQETKQKYKALHKKCKDGYKLYNIFEQTILEKPLANDGLGGCGINKEELDDVVHRIKIIAMGMQRYNPTNWNTLIETAMGQTSFK